MRCRVDTMVAMKIRNTAHLALVALALSVNLLGDWLRDALNPRLK